LVGAAEVEREFGQKAVAAVEQVLEKMPFGVERPARPLGRSHEWHLRPRRRQSTFTIPGGRVRKRGSTAARAVLVGFLLGRSALAQTGGGTVSPAEASPSSGGDANEEWTRLIQAITEEAHGKVEKVDAKRKRVTLSDGTRLQFDPSSTIVKDGRLATLSELRKGDDVRVSFAPGSATEVLDLNAMSPSK